VTSIHERRLSMGDGGKNWCGGGNGAFAGTTWFAAWLFTIAFLKLTFWKAVFAIVIWPYYLGVFFRK